MSFSVVYLEEIQESNKLATPVIDIVKILLAAINDWPNPIINLVDYENEIHELVGVEIDKKKMESYILKIDYSKNAWEAESLSQLIEIYNYFDEKKTLKEILEEIKDKLVNCES
jgi:hypothetical protein